MRAGEGAEPEGPPVVDDDPLGQVVEPVLEEPKHKGGDLSGGHGR